jgi:hypothetical protein
MLDAADGDTIVPRNRPPAMFQLLDRINTAMQQVPGSENGGKQCPPPAVLR